jgi:hypothetical protein
VIVKKLYNSIAEKGSIFLIMKNNLCLSCCSWQYKWYGNRLSGTKTTKKTMSGEVSSTGHCAAVTQSIQVVLVEGSAAQGTAPP